jgi:hypothetical protein
MDGNQMKLKFLPYESYEMYLKQNTIQNNDEKSFLTTENLETSSRKEDDNHLVNQQHQQLFNDRTIPEESESYNEFLLKNSSPFKERRITKSFNNNNNNIVSYPPLSINALMEYKNVLPVRGSGPFKHGINKLFNGT